MWLVLLLILCLSAPLLAADEPAQRPKPNAAPFSLNLNLMPYARLQAGPDTVSGLPLRRLPGMGSPLCYTGRIYLMERENPRSDVTRPSGTRTCSNASVYRMKEVPATEKK